MLVLLIISCHGDLIVRQSIESSAARRAEHDVGRDHHRVNLTRRRAVPERQARCSPGSVTAVTEAFRQGPEDAGDHPGDKAVSHGLVVWVLDVLKSLGVASSRSLSIRPSRTTDHSMTVLRHQAPDLRVASLISHVAIAQSSSCCQRSGSKRETAQDLDRASCRARDARPRRRPPKPDRAGAAPRRRCTSYRPPKPNHCELGAGRARYAAAGFIPRSPRTRPTAGLFGGHDGIDVGGLRRCRADRNRRRLSRARASGPQAVSARRVRLAAFEATKMPRAAWPCFGSNRGGPRRGYGGHGRAELVVVRTAARRDIRSSRAVTPDRGRGRRFEDCHVLARREGRQAGGGVTCEVQITFLLEEATDIVRPVVLRSPGPWRGATGDPSFDCKTSGCSA